MAFAPDAVIFIPGFVNGSTASIHAACPFVSVWGFFSDVCLRTPLLHLVLCRCQRHGSFLPGTSVAAHCSAMEVFSQDVFLIFPQKSTLLGGGFDVCQLVWRGRAIVSKKFSSSKRIWKFIRILWTFNFTSMCYSEVFFCCLCVFSRLIVIHRRLWLFAQGLWRLMWTLSCSRI